VTEPSEFERNEPKELKLENNVMWLRKADSAAIRTDPTIPTRTGVGAQRPGTQARQAPRPVSSVHRDILQLTVSPLCVHDFSRVLQ
jgi:hypothetical protein